MAWRSRSASTKSSSNVRGGERRFNVTIGAKPFTLNVDF